MNGAELELLTVAELARLAKQHPDTVYKAIAAGRLQVVRPGGARAVRVTLEEARRYLTGAGAEATISPLHSLQGGKP